MLLILRLFKQIRTKTFLQKGLYYKKYTILFLPDSYNIVLQK